MAQNKKKEQSAVQFSIQWYSRDPFDFFERIKKVFRKEDHRPINNFVLQVGGDFEFNWPSGEGKEIGCFEDSVLKPIQIDKYIHERQNGEISVIYPDDTTPLSLVSAPDIVPNMVAIVADSACDLSAVEERFKLLIPYAKNLRWYDNAEDKDA